MDHLLGFNHATQRMPHFWMKHWVAPHRFTIGRRHVVKRDSPEAVAFQKLHNAEFGLTDASGVRKNGLKHRIKFASKRTDDLQHLRRGGLPLKRLAQFTSKSSDLPLLGSREQL